MYRSGVSFVVSEAGAVKHLEERADALFEMVNMQWSGTILVSGDYSEKHFEIIHVNPLNSSEITKVVQKALGDCSFEATPDGFILSKDYTIYKIHYK